MLYWFSIVLAYIFILITGFHDEGNLIATIISSKSLNAAKAFAAACLSQFLGTLLIGDKVANTMATGIVKSQYLAAGGISAMAASALAGAILWNMLTWYFCIPSSSTHAIVGSLMGPFVLRFGFSSLNVNSVLIFILLPLFFSPLVGYKLAYWLMKLTNAIGTHFSILIYPLLKKAQLFTLIFLNMEQGSNDAQKGLGIILLLSISRYGFHKAQLSISDKFFAAAAIALGLAFGGYRMIKSVGTKIYKVRPVHSINAQIASFLIVFFASNVGAPISGTQVVNSAIVGVGAAERPNAVGWGYVGNMFIGWLITIPCSFLFSACFYLLLGHLR